MFNHYKMLSVLMFLLTCLVYGQPSRTMTAMKVQDGTITVDGYLNEGVWGSAEKHKVDQVTYGTVDNDADCYADVSSYYNNTGVFVAVWFHDDVHNAMNSQYLDAANIAYDDDGWEVMIDHNYDDAIGAGLYDWHLVKGLGNLEPTLQFGGMWGDDDGSGKGWSTALYTPQQQVDIGWTEVFTTDDGLTYHAECFFAWSGSILRNIPPKGPGENLAFDIKINDNDGGFGTEGCMTFSGQSHLNGNTYWGTIQLGGTAGLSPTKVTRLYSSSRGLKNGRFDLLGRSVAQSKHGFAANRILIVRNEQGKAVRSIAR